MKHLYSVLQLTAGLKHTRPKQPQGCNTHVMHTTTYCVDLRFLCGLFHVRYNLITYLLDYLFTYSISYLLIYVLTYLRTQLLIYLHTIFN